MFFSASKIFWGLCAPTHMLLWCSLLAALLLFTRHRAIGRALTVATALLLVGMGVVPSYTWLMRPIEHRFDPSGYPAHVDGILVLGGGTEDTIRLAKVAMLARRYPDARVVYSGGDGGLIGNQPDVAANQAWHFLLALGVAPGRVTVEGKSRNTFENFQFTQNLVKPKPGQIWLLATSGYHLPRAMAIADKMGWKFIPWPTNHLTMAEGTYGYFSVADNLRSFDMTIREWIGILAYRWSGRAAH